MTDFWLSCGHHFLDRNESGGYVVTDDFLKVYLARPELLPPAGSIRHGNCDPITGQAAWYDLRVRIEKALPEEIGEAEPQFPALSRPPNMAAPPGLVRDARARVAAPGGGS